MKKIRFEFIISITCLVILAVFLCLVIAGWFYRRNELRMNQNTNDSKSFKTEMVKKYPFTESNEVKASAKLPMTDKITRKVRGLDSQLNNYLTVYLPGYYQMAEAGRKYDQIMQWDYSYFGEYNAVVRLSDGYLTSYIPEKNISDSVQSVVSLKKFCDENHISFVYVQSFYKINALQDSDVYGTLDFSNQNTDKFLNALKEHQIDYLDLRQFVSDEKLNQHQLFFRTDHHWLPQTARWVSQKILQYLSRHYHFETDISRLDKDKFKETIYPQWFLGSQGKKVTLAQTDPEDFTLIYPLYETDLEINVPSIHYTASGDFSITYDMSQLDEKDFYSIKPRHTTMYDAYGYGQRPIIVIHNKQAKNSKKVLLIRDSFGDTALPFLALGMNTIHALDLRLFTGSLKQYILSEKPDMVVVMYTPEKLGPVDWTDHTSLFDFR